MVQNTNEQYKKQWSKFMFSFFDYLPTKYEASKQEWKIRKMIWDFKDGKRSLAVAELVAKKIRQQFGAEAGSVVLACIPASSEAANTARYGTFANEVCRLAGTVNAFQAITIEGERLAIHEYKGSKVVSNVQVIKKVRLSSGGIDGTYVDVRLLLKQAILNNATCIVMVHNHPSGNKTPSQQDRLLTANIKKAAETMNIRLTDHVIVCDGGYYSFSDEGMI